MPRTKKRADGRYCRQIYLGKDESGKRKYKTIYAETSKEADRLAAEYRAAIGRGLDVTAGPKTVKELLDNLLAVKKAQGVGASWLRSIGNHIDHLQPLWSTTADRLRSGDVQRVLNALAGDRLAHKTLREILATLKAAYTLAIPEIVQYNPCDRVVVPAGRAAEPRSWLNDEQQGWVRSTPHRAQRAAMLMMYSGLRRGEATALTWADVDLDKRTVSVTKSWDFASGRMKTPKTSAGTRVVHIPQLLADFLRAERVDDPDTLHVIHTADGRRMTEIAWRRLWNSYMAALNAKYAFDCASVFATRKKGADGRERGALPIVIRTFTPHELRHTFCTILYQAGVDVLTARDQMGHASVQVTQEIYTHLDAKHKAEKMEQLDDFLKASGK